jgi:hypothetical protein
LAEGVGDEGAHGLLGAGHKAIKAVKKHGDKVAVAKTVAKGVGYTGAAAAGVKGLSALSGGE